MQITQQILHKVVNNPSQLQSTACFKLMVYSIAPCKHEDILENNANMCLTCAPWWFARDFPRPIHWANLTSTLFSSMSLVPSSSGGQSHRQCHYIQHLQHFFRHYKEQGRPHFLNQPCLVPPLLLIACCIK